MTKKKVAMGFIMACVVWISIPAFAYRAQISESIVRKYRNIKRSQTGDLMIQTYAGCQPKTMMENETNESFSEEWSRDSNTFNFDAIDVDRYMMKNCPPKTPAEIASGYEKYYESYNEYSRENNQSEIGINEQSETIQKAIIKGIAVSEYKRKFLNREFDILFH